MLKNCPFFPKLNAFMLNLYYPQYSISHTKYIPFHGLWYWLGIPVKSPLYPLGQVAHARVSSKHLHLAIFQHCITHFHRENKLMDMWETPAFFSLLLQCVVYKETTKEKQKERFCLGSEVQTLSPYILQSNKMYLTQLCVWFRLGY